MGATTGSKKADIEKLTSGVPILSFNEEIAGEAGNIHHKLRRMSSLIDFRDIFIGATCIVYDLPILTTNIKRFERIEGLKILQ